VRDEFALRGEAGIGLLWNEKIIQEGKGVRRFIAAYGFYMF